MLLFFILAGVYFNNQNYKCVNDITVMDENLAAVAAPIPVGDNSLKNHGTYTSGLFKLILCHFTAADPLCLV